MSEFIYTTIDLIDRELSELGVNSESEPGVIGINKSHVSAFRISPGDDVERTCVYLSCGESLIVNMTYQEFKAAIE